MLFDFDPNDQDCLKTGFWLFIGVFFGPFILYFFIYLEMLYGPVARVPVFVFLGFLVYKIIQKIVEEYKEAKRILEQNPDCVQGGACFFAEKRQEVSINAA